MLPDATEALSDPSWTDKLEAWSTLGGAIFTAAAVIVAFLVWRHDRRKRLEDKRDLEAAQARQIFATVAQATGDREAGLTGVRVLVHNNSPSHASLIVVSASPAGRRPPRRQRIERLDPGDSVPKTVVFSGSLPWPFRHAQASPSELEQEFRVNLTFVDSAGLRWRRAGLREPQRVRTADQQERSFVYGAVPRRLVPLLAEYLYISPMARAVAKAALVRHAATVDRLEGRLFDRTERRWRRASQPRVPESGTDATAVGAAASDQPPASMT